MSKNSSDFKLHGLIVSEESSIAAQQIQENVSVFFNTPLAWDELHLSWDDLKPYDLSWDDLKISLNELIKIKSDKGLEAVLKIIKGWLIVYIDYIPAIFKASVLYPNIVVLFSAKIVLERQSADCYMEWLWKRVIGKVSSERKDLYVWKEKSQSALVKFSNEEWIDGLINDINRISGNVENYFKGCVCNLYKDFYRKENLYQERMEMSSQCEENSDEYLGMDAYGDFTTEESIGFKMTFEEILNLVTERQFGILSLKYKNPKMTNDEIASELGVNVRTIKRDLVELRNNDKLKELFI